jgi:hypothetical protein
MITLARLWFLVAAIATSLPADEVTWWPEYLRPDPLARIVPPDRSGQPISPKLAFLTGARGGYVSAQLVVLADQPQPYRVDFQLIDKSGKLQLDVYREWFHYTPSDKNFYPDALVPIQPPYESRLPEEDNRIKGQLSQAFWVDIWIPADTPPGEYSVRGSLRTPRRGTRSATFKLRVLDLVIPREDAVTIDHNSYGSSFLEEQYPRIAREYQGDFYTSDDFFRLIHAHHRIFYEHRGTFHQLGYGR